LINSYFVRLVVLAGTQLAEAQNWLQQQLVSMHAPPTLQNVVIMDLMVNAHQLVRRSIYPGYFDHALRSTSVLHNFLQGFAP
jgi:hypothetical protein